MEKITAIIPNYNYADFIIERIDSIINQTCTISELIILDDASSDDSVKVIEEKINDIKKKKPEIRTKIIVNKKNSGGCVFAQWQKGLKNATGDYIWIAEADDSADIHFLETAMKKFKCYPKASLFYADSKRIDQDGKEISATSVDLEDIWGSGRWEKDYYNNGIHEITNYLSANNTIINVSGVVWKNSDYLMEVFEEAKSYKIAGDWYIYTRVLEYGDIIYSSKPLNYYRKHNKGSVSSVTNLMREYEEVVKIQERIKQKFNLSDSQQEWQRKRRMMMGMVENEKNISKKGRIAWLVPDFIGGSGGHRTIFQNINELVVNGYACDMYVRLFYGERTPEAICDEIANDYGEFSGDIYTGFDLLGVKDYDAVVATSWDTAEPVLKTDVEKKLYFIQDYEPWFFPMGENYLLARKSYDYGFDGISIGNWLARKIHKESGVDMRHFSFCADLDIYKKDKKIKREDAVCFIYQPNKPRRCSEMGLRALQIIQSEKPDLKIYLYGSPKMTPFNLNAEHLGLLNVDECNELYNKCKVGICMSSSNPSRVPFEMMAAGLPVVDLYLENNLYDLPEGGCLLAEPSAEAIAAAVLKILNDDKLRNTLADGGAKYMKDFPMERGFKEFMGAVNDYVGGNEIYEDVIDKIYRRKAVKPLRTEVCLPKVFFKTKEEMEAEREVKRLKEEVEKDKKWRENLTIPQRIYLKIRYILTGR